MASAALTATARFRLRDQDVLVASRVRAAEPLVERITTRPLAELGSDRLGGNDLRLLLPGTAALCEGARNAADRKRFDGSADIARSGGGMLKRQRVKACEVFAVHERPAHSFVLHHADRTAFDGFASEAEEDAAAGFVDHRRVDHDAL